MNNPMQLLKKNADPHFFAGIEELISDGIIEWVPDPKVNAVWGLQTTGKSRNPDAILAGVRCYLLLILYPDGDFENTFELECLIR